jgi:hypothetical protein
MDMKFGTWTIRSVYRAGSLMTVSRELSKYKLDLMIVEEVTWMAVALKQQENTLLYGKGNENHVMGAVFCT